MGVFQAEHRVKLIEVFVPRRVRGPDHVPRGASGQDQLVPRIVYRAKEVGLMGGPEVEGAVKVLEQLGQERKKRKRLEAKRRKALQKLAEAFSSEPIDVVVLRKALAAVRGTIAAGGGSSRRKPIRDKALTHTAEQQKELTRKRTLRDYRAHMVKARKCVTHTHTHLNAKGVNNKIVKTMLKDMTISDGRCEKFIAKIDNVELADKALAKNDIESMETESSRIEANSKAVEALLASV